MPPNIPVAIERVQQSNMQPSEKGALTKALAYLGEPPRAMGIVPMSRAAGPIEFIAEQGIAAMTGAVLGTLHAELKDGLDRNGKPLDGGIALVTGVAGLFGSKVAQEISKDCTVVLTFRKTESILSAIKELSKAADAPDPDPVKEAGKGI